MNGPKRRKGRRRVWIAAGFLLLATTAATAYWLTRPQIIFLGFPSMYRFVLAEASAKTGVRYDAWSAEKVDDPKLEFANFRRYQVIYVSARRSDPLPQAIKQALSAAQTSGSRVIVIPPHHTERLGVGSKDFHGNEAWIEEYWQFGGAENMARFLQATAALHLSQDQPVEPPVPTPDDGYYHPDAAETFTTTSAYLDWYEKSGRFKAGAPKVIVDFADGWKFGMNLATDALIRAFEEKGVNIGAIFGVAMAGPFAVEFQPDLIISRKHGRWWLGDAGVELLETKLNVPLMRGLSLLFTGETFNQYRQTRAGIRGAGLAMGAMVPELDGAIEPTLIEGLEAEWYGRRLEAVDEERIDRLTDRALSWIRLRQTPNPDKRVAIVYVSGIGKGKITAAGLNLPRSLVRFLHAMRADGYLLSQIPVDEEALLDQMLTKGRNISESQVGELRGLAAMEDVTLLPADGYIEWFRALPQTMQSEVESAFGPPPGRFMTLERDGKTYFVIPKLRFGNVLVLPQPARGARMDAKLQHNDRVPPPHQYLAVYWWLREVWKADAILNYGTHGTHEFLPGRPLGQLADDWSDQVLGLVPNIYVYVMDNVGEALIAKRRGSAVTVSHQIPPVAAASLSEADRAVGELYRATEQFLAQEDGALKERLRERIRLQAHEMEFDRDLGTDWSGQPPSDEQVKELQLHIHLINEDKVPLGLHVHSQVSVPGELAPLITAILGKPYVQRVAAREFDFRDDRGETYERAKQRANEMVKNALDGSSPDPALREDHARVMELQQAFQGTAREIPRTLGALRGEFVPPGGGGDPVRNPRSLPTGRNLYGINPSEVPTRAAWEVGVQLAKDLLDRERARLGRWPRKVGFTLWNTEVIRQYGTDLAQILFLLGVHPVWDHNGIAADVALIPAVELGRPRIDVVIQAASLFRDTFPDRMTFLDKAVRLSASAGDGENYVAEHSRQAELDLKQSGLSVKEARLYAAARVFSNSAGGYGTGLIDGIERSGSYSDTKELTKEYLARTGAVYTAGAEWGAFIPGLYQQALRDTDAVCLSRSTNVVSPLTLDHYFEYLGGMTMAVRDTTGTSPETYVADVRQVGRPGVETLQETLTRDLRGKFWNQKWIEAQMDEGFSGAVEIAQTATNLFGWQVTKPEAIGDYVWEHVYQVYIDDSLELGVREWFEDQNPYAYQNLTAVLLEAVRKGYWDASPAEVEVIANRYAQSVASHGPAGDPRTVDNAALEQFVQDTLQAPGDLEGIELSSLYWGALQRSAGASDDRPLVAGQMLVEQGSAEWEPRSARYSTGMGFAVFVVGAAFLIGLRRRRGSV